jgi:AcrR family transcriptional regulator
MSTREQFLAVATRQFAEKGFYGASIAGIASELGLTKQALLHHFGSKEKLYGEILQSISRETLAELAAITASVPRPAAQLEAIVLHQYRDQVDQQDAARLLMRELLDNERRAEKAGNWYLKPYLEALVDIARAADDSLDPARALALVYQLLGAATYVAVSQPTLTQIFGRQRFSETRAVFEEELRQLIRARLGAPTD